MGIDLLCRKSELPVTDLREVQKTSNGAIVMEDTRHSKHGSRGHLLVEGLTDVYWVIVDTT